MSFHGPFHGFSLAFKISYLSNHVELSADFYSHLWLPGIEGWITRKLIFLNGAGVFSPGLRMRLMIIVPAPAGAVGLFYPPFLDRVFDVSVTEEDVRAAFMPFAGQPGIGRHRDGVGSRGQNVRVKRHIPKGVCARIAQQNHVAGCPNLP